MRGQPGEEVIPINYLSFPVGQASAGAVVEVALSGCESDVFLVDDFNLAKFKRGQSFCYAGGHYNRSPVRLAVPSAGHWTAVVIPMGGRVSASARLVA